MARGAHYLKGDFVRLSVCTVLESSIDWLTLTATNDKDTASLQTHATAMAKEVEEVGNILAPWAILGYHGWKCGTIAFGKSAQGGILVASGPDAGVALGRCYGPTLNVTRVDLQVTIRLHPPDDTVAAAAYNEIVATEPSKRRFVSATVLSGSDGGSTCYVGRRASDSYARLYNKERESHDPGYIACWRYEVELKRDRAAHAVRMLPTGDERSRWISGFVHCYFADRGHVPPWRPDGVFNTGGPRRPVSDTERRIRWLREQVAPSVSALRARGYSDQVLTALGLRDMPIAADDLLADPRFGSHTPIERA